MVPIGFRPFPAFIFASALLVLPLNLAGSSSMRIPARASLRSPASTATCLNDVKAAFAAIDTENGERIKLRTRGFISGKNYTMAAWNRLGLDNHFQGIQFLEDPRYFAISGANIRTKRAELFIAELAPAESAQDEEPTAERESPPRMIARLALGDSVLWHAGGLARAGSVLVVPIEAYKISKTSVIRLYDVSAPAEPKLLTTLNRPQFDAGAVALTRLDDGHWLLIAYSNGIYDFYRSRTAAIADGFDETDYVRRDWSAIPEATGSNLNFIDQCDGKKFLITFRNTGKAPPFLLNGRDLSGLVEFAWNGGDPAIRVAGEKHFSCGTSCNFAGAAGSRITENGGLALYSTYTFRNLLNGKLRLKVFSSSPNEAK